MHQRTRHAIVFAAVSVTAFGCSSSDSTTPDTQGSNVACDGQVCRVSGTLTEDTTFTKDKKWLLEGGVFVGDDTNETDLTIEPGTTVYGDSSTLSMLVIRRGSKLIANGTRDAPIVLTSSKKPGTRARGDWGGLILNGRAPINSCSKGMCEAEGEGGTGTYGGDDPHDSSGVLHYVRVEFAGSLISPDNELNGIGFQGVGDGTDIDYVQVHMNKDDGIEFFGGTANWKHVICTGIGDDNLDWTSGWRGKGQFFIGQQYDDTGDNGIEADNNADDNLRQPRSMPKLANITLLGVPDGAGSDIGVLLREGTGAQIHDLVVSGFNEGCLDIDNKETFDNAYDGSKLTGQLTMNNSVVYCNALNQAPDFVDDDDFTPPFTVKDWFMQMNQSNQVVDPMLDGYVPKSDSPLLGGGTKPADAFFDDVDYIGAVGTDDWTAGWTTDAKN